MPALEPPRFVDGNPSYDEKFDGRSNSGYLEIWIPVESAPAA